MDPTPTTTRSAHPHPVGGPRRWLYVGLGAFFVGLGAVGAFLPVLPTTPFLLLASYFFVRSSPTLHRWLLRSPLLGPFLRDWQRHRGVRPRVKVTALAVLGLGAGSSAAFANLSGPLLGLLGLLTAVGAYVVLRLPIIRDEAPGDVEMCPLAAPDEPGGP